MKYLLLSCVVAAVVNYHNRDFAIHNTPLVVIKDTVPVSSDDVISNETLEGKWKLQPVLSSDTAAGKTPTLNFDFATKRITGNTGCNSFGASFNTKGDALNFRGDMISTKIACPGYNEKIFLENLLRTNRFEIKNGVLHLMYNTTILSNWARHADTSTTKKL